MSSYSKLWLNGCTVVVHKGFRFIKVLKDNSDNFILRTGPLYSTYENFIFTLLNLKPQIFRPYITLNVLRQWYAAFRLMCGGLLFAKKPGIRCLTDKTPDSCLQPQCGPQ